jgi:hypothetical protein
MMQFESWVKKNAVPSRTEGNPSCIGFINKKNTVIFLVVLSAVVILAFICCFFALLILMSKHRSEISQLNTITDESVSSIEDKLGKVRTNIEWFKKALVGYHPLFPTPASCATLPHSSPSGHYWLQNYNGSAVRVYCDMTRLCGGITGGWRRVAELLMYKSSHQCPSGFIERNDSSNQVRTCAGILNHSCNPITFSTDAIEYSKVCGKIIGYQFGVPNAFANGRHINQHYVDGVSLTHGHPRQHIWTFAAARDEVSSNPSDLCPCTNIVTASRASRPPESVGDDYFCDTGSHVQATGQFYLDALWNGIGCGRLSSCCTFNDPPWFFKQLPQPTTDDIEMRVCRDNSTTLEDVTIKTVEIYVQ